MHTLYFVGNAHIDPVWLWRWQDGYAEVRATFRSVLDRMRETPDLRFSCACAAYYEWIEQADPAMFDEIRARVREGRWELTGGWWIQPDCNFPSGESFARHALISQRYFRSRFGKIARTGYCVDSFGHNGNLPAILRRSGMDRYVFMRPGPHEKPLPQSLFDWKSADGSTVRTFRIPVTYCFNRDQLEQQLPGLIAQMRQEGTDWMVFYGIGNHGGGPSAELIRCIQTQAAQYPDVQFRFSTLTEYFDDHEAQAVPTVVDDLQFHAKGCYSANAGIKRANRAAENALRSAEAWTVAAQGLLGDAAVAPDASAERDRAWKNVLFNQFHDILDGCAIRDAYEDASYALGEAMHIAQVQENRAVHALSWAIDTVGDFDPADAVHRGWYDFHEVLGTPVVVANPLPWPVQATVRMGIDASRVTDAAGYELPIQSVRAPMTVWGTNNEALVRIDLPAMGYRVCRVFSGTAPDAPALRCTDDCIENDFLRLRLRDGQPVELTDKSAGRNLLAGSADAVLIDDTASDTWAHGLVRYDGTVRAFRAGSSRLIESGAVRAVLRAETQCEAVRMVQEYTLTADGRSVGVCAAVDFRAPYQVLKLRFPVAAGADSVFETEIPFGHIAHLADGAEQPCGVWSAVHGADGGLTVANRTITSQSADGSVLSLTPLRGTPFADHTCGDLSLRDGAEEIQDQGIQHFAYTLAPFTTIQAADRLAQKLNVPPTVTHTTFHKGPLPTAWSGITVTGDVTVTAVKPGADGGVIVRAYDCGGGGCASFVLAAPNASWDAVFAPSEIKTFRIANGTVTECDFLEESGGESDDCIIFREK